MDYEKAYKEAIERAKEMSALPDDRATMEYIFPELAESEDEKIRKEIIHLVVKSQEQGGYALHKDEAKEMIAWLEKQGEQVDNLHNYLYGEQNPAWSDVDEIFVHGLIRGLSAKRDIHGHTTFGSDYLDITETIDWLKSRKERLQSHWKPSNEQIAALDEVYKTHGADNACRRVILGLLNELKKLKEE